MKAKGLILLSSLILGLCTYNQSDAHFYGLLGKKWTLRVVNEYMPVTIKIYPDSLIDKDAIRKIKEVNIAKDKSGSYKYPANKNPYTIAIRTHEAYVIFPATILNEKSELLIDATGNVELGGEKLQGKWLELGPEWRK